MANSTTKDILRSGSVAGAGMAAVRPRQWRDPIVQWLIFGLTVVLVAAPILPIVYQSFLDRPLYEDGGSVSLANYQRLLTDGAFGLVLGKTLLFAAMATAISQVLGVTAAIVVGRTDVPLRGAFGEVLVWPLYISQLVLAFGWIIMYGPSGYVTLQVSQMLGGITPWNLYSLPGMALVAGISASPLTFFYCISAVRSQDSTLEDAARVSGAGPLRALLTITLPLLRPAILHSTMLNLVIALEILSIPLILGSPVGIELLTTLLYERGLEAPVKDYGLVGAAAVILLLLITLMTLTQSFLLKNSHRFVTVGGKASRPRLVKLGFWRWAVFTALVLYLLLGIVVVIFGLIMRSFTTLLSPFIAPWKTFTLSNWSVIFSYDAYSQSITNTLTLGIIGGVVGTFLVMMIAFVVHRSNFRFRRPLEYIALYPRALPGIVVGIGGFYAVALLPILGPLRSTIWILLFVYLMRYIPTSYGAISPMLMQINKDLDRASRTMGADWLTTMIRVTAGLIKPALFASFVLIFVHILKDYSVALFLFSPGSEVVGTTMLSFWLQGNTGPVAALALMQIGITAVVVIICRVLFKVKLYG